MLGGITYNFDEIKVIPLDHKKSTTVTQEVVVSEEPSPQDASLAQGIRAHEVSQGIWKTKACLEESDFKARLKKYSSVEKIFSDLENVDHKENAYDEANESKLYPAKIIHDNQEVLFPSPRVIHHLKSMFADWQKGQIEKVDLINQLKLPYEHGGIPETGALKDKLLLMLERPESLTYFDTQKIYAEAESLGRGIKDPEYGYIKDPYFEVRPNVNLFASPLVRDEDGNIMENPHCLIPVDEQGNLVPRKKGLKTAVNQYLHYLRDHEPEYFQICCQEAVKLLKQNKCSDTEERNPMSQSCEMVIPAAAHYSENITQYLEVLAKDNMDKGKYEVILFINGDESKESHEQIQARIEEVKTFQDSNPDMKIRIANGVLPEWRFGARNIPITLSLMLAQMSGIDHDLTICGYDVDILKLDKGHMAKKNGFIQSGSLLVGAHGIQEDLKSLLEQNINAYILERVWHIYLQEFDFKEQLQIKTGTKLGVDEPEGRRENISLPGGDFANSAILYCLLGGVLTDCKTGEDTQYLIDRARDFSLARYPKANNIIFDTEGLHIHCDGGSNIRALHNKVPRSDKYFAHSGRKIAGIPELKSDSPMTIDLDRIVCELKHDADKAKLDLRRLIRIYELDTKLEDEVFEECQQNFCKRLKEELGINIGEEGLGFLRRKIGINAESREYAMKPSDIELDLNILKKDIKQMLAAHAQGLRYSESGKKGLSLAK